MGDARPRPRKGSSTVVARVVLPRLVRGRLVIVRLVAGFVVAGMLSVGAVAVSSASASDPGVTVDVVDDSSTPGPSPSTGTGSTGTGLTGTGSTGGGFGSPGQTGTTSGSATPPATATVAPGERVLFVVAGLTASGSPSANPLAGGRVTASVSVQNLTTQAFDAEAEFHLDDLFGNELAASHVVLVTALQPGELRSVSVDLGEVQFAGLGHAYATVTPPAKVADVELAPVTRDTWTVLPSWYAVGVLAAAGISTAAWAYFRRRGL